MSDAEIYDGVVKRLSETYKAKNHDYGDSCHKAYHEFGLVSFLVRLSDKLNRAITLAKKTPRVHDDSIKDTLQDMANYAILACVELEKSKPYSIPPPEEKKTGRFNLDWKTILH